MIAATDELIALIETAERRLAESARRSSLAAGTQGQPTEPDAWADSMAARGHRAGAGRTIGHGDPAAEAGVVREREGGGIERAFSLPWGSRYPS